MLFCHNQLNSQHVLETSKTCCEERGDNEEDQDPLFECAHCLDTTHIRERLLARRVEEKRRTFDRGVEHGGRIMSDQTHCHGDVETVLRKKAGYITLPITLDASLHTHVWGRDDIQEAKDKEEHESSKKKLLTFHCVFPQKNGS